MANRNATKSTRATRTAVVATPAVVAPVIATIDGATTIDGIVAFARTITPATFVESLAAIRTAFPGTNARRNVGRTTNRRITDFQNWAFDMNATWQLDDVALAAVWVAEFPAAVGKVFMGHPADMVGIIRSVRAQYNGGKHDAPAPAAASVAYGDTARVAAAKLFPRPVAPVAVAPVAAPAPVAEPVITPAAKSVRGRKRAA